MDSFLRDNLLNIWLLARVSSVVVGSTREAGQPPRGWSDHFLATQNLAILVEQALKGDFVPERVIRLSVPVVQGSRISAPKPGLAPWIVERGSRAVYFIQNGQISDEDLGILKGEPGVIQVVKEMCGGRLPPGTGSVLYLLSESVKSDPRVKSAFVSVEPVVLDVVQPGHGTARLTVVRDSVTVLTGLRLERVAKTRQADRTVQATAGEVARMLLGEQSIETLPGDGNLRSLREALKNAIPSLKANADRVAEIRAAGGLD